MICRTSVKPLSNNYWTLLSKKHTRLMSSSWWFIIFIFFGLLEVMFYACLSSCPFPQKRRIICNSKMVREEEVTRTNTELENTEFDNDWLSHQQTGSLRAVSSTTSNPFYSIMIDRTRKQFNITFCVFGSWD